MADVVLPTTVDELVAARAAAPDALLLAGGTDLMVAVNAGWTAPRSVVALRRVDALRGVRVDGDEVVVGAATTYRDLLAPDVAALVPALAQAARTVGSPQIRAAGTVGGNIGTASPAGDTLPVLVAAGATIEVAGADGARSLPATEVFVGVKRTALRPDEVVTAVRLPAAAGPQAYKKVGVRNAMVIAVASVALVVDTGRRRVGLGLGSVGPVPLFVPDASAFAAGAIDWDAAAGPGLIDPGAARRFGEMAAAASAPIDDHRSTAAYRRHAVGVMAARALRDAFPTAGSHAA
ncbi:xanthine dehydrogenase family protein subunit M [Iamia sp. SCSIO 61187]|uniref:FAD binding domain-containing protein n=1 Tax=Iamia sp. SCSIO 61187 TaxID=2722752 RepID=UPI001C63A5A7|nr:FAD binding domain-containing protein [Iamia sp. SCSIO 61187]QYG93135.1 xanthine dehydrogenase family protein subunit M [Iamia sp. SCSIO 61187]